MITNIHELTVKIFADGADLAGLGALVSNPTIKGFTTNPTLMRQAGVVNYEQFARAVVELVGSRPVSFEVFSDDFEEMEKQAKRLATLGDSVYVKIPVTNTHGESSDALVRHLAADGVRVNVTAVFTVRQVERMLDCLADAPPAFISVFAGRIADAGVDPIPVMRASLASVADSPDVELIWASPREVYNVVQADEIGCHIITVTSDLLKKLPSLGKHLEQFSLETVQMFHRDAAAAGYSL